MPPAPIVRVRLPASLRPLAGGRAEVRGDGWTLAEVLRSIRREHPELCDHLLDAEGRLRRYVTFFLNGEDVRFAGGAGAPVREGDELSVVPALSGGAAREPEPGAAVPGAGVDDLERALPVLARLAERSPGEEVCGLVLAGGGGGSGAEVVPVRNEAPDRARAFQMDPGAVLAVLRSADARGWSVKAIYHSHVEGTAALSPVDRACLEAEGRPLWPDAEAWVIALEEGRAVELRAHAWEGNRYVERGRLRAPSPNEDRRVCVEPAQAPESPELSSRASGCDHLGSRCILPASRGRRAGE